MNERNLLQVGVIGTVVAALCCFTPILVVLLGAVGLSAVVGWLDYVLLPALAFFVGLVIYAVVRRHRERARRKTGAMSTLDDAKRARAGE